MQVPHGFEIESLTERKAPEIVASAVFERTRVTAVLAVPVLYTPEWRGVLRAVLLDRDERLPDEF